MSPDPESPTRERRAGLKSFRPLLPLRWRLVVPLVGSVILATLVLIVKLQPIAPYRQAAVSTLRAELAQLPPYPGSVVVQSNTKADIFEPSTSMEVDYDSPGRCSDVQGYYATQAQKAGWSMQGQLRTLDPDSNPDHDALDARYQKDSRGYTVGLVIECFVDESYQRGYSVFLDTPPAPTPGPVALQPALPHEAQTGALEVGVLLRQRSVRVDQYCMGIGRSDGR